MKVTDFRPGDVVEIRATGFPHYWGTQGVVQKSDDETYVHVYVKEKGIGGWLPTQLRMVDVTRERIEAELGEGYLD